MGRGGAGANTNKAAYCRVYGMPRSPHSKLCHIASTTKQPLNVHRVSLREGHPLDAHRGAIVGPHHSCLETGPSSDTRCTTERKQQKKKPNPTTHYLVHRPSTTPPQIPTDRLRVNRAIRRGVRTRQDSRAAHERHLRATVGAVVRVKVLHTFVVMCTLFSRSVLDAFTLERVVLNTFAL